MAATNVFAQSPLDPRDRDWRHPSCGLLRERHRWRLPVGGEMALLHEAYRLRRPHPLEGTEQALPPIARSVPDHAVGPLPHRYVFGRPDDGLLRELLIGRAVSLAFASGQLPQDAGPAQTRNQIVSKILGQPLPQMYFPGIFSLDDVQRDRALEAMARSSGADLYLFVEPDTDALHTHRETLRAMLRTDEPILSWSAFHQILCSCSYMLCTHRSIPGAAPIHVYTMTPLSPDVKLTTSSDRFHREAGQSPEHLSARAPVDDDGTLDIAWTNITSLEGIGAQPSVTRLAAEGALVADFTPLSSLPSLRHLSVDRWSDAIHTTNLTDLTCADYADADLRPLRRFPALRGATLLGAAALSSARTGQSLGHLETLSLQHTALRSLAGLQTPNLRTLSVSATQLEDAQGDWPALRTLSLSARGLSPAPLPANLPANLTTLTLRRLVLPALQPLCALTGLETLILEENRLADLSGLMSLERLRTLHLVRAAAEDYAALAGLSLTRLSLRECPAAAFSILPMLPWLTHLDCSWSAFSDVGLLAGMPLEELDLGFTAVAAVSGLPPLRSLSIAGFGGSVPSGSLRVTDSLDVTRCPNFRAESLYDRPRLRLLRAARSGLDSLAGLDVTALKTLDITETAVHDLSPLRAAGLLCSLSIGDTGAEDLSPLSDMPIEALRLARTPVADLSVLSSLRWLRVLDLRGRTLSPDDQRVLRELRPLRALYLDEEPPEAIQLRHRVLTVTMR